MQMKWLLAASVAVLMMSPVAMAQETGHGDHMGERKEHRQEKMEKIDTDQDGKISKDEFLAAHAAKFDEMDGDKDGFLSAEERKAAWEKHRGKMKERMKDWRAKKAEGGKGEAEDAPAEETSD